MRIGMNFNIHRVFFTVLIAGVFLYIGGGLYLFLVQKSMIYFPDNQDFYACEPFGDYEKKEINDTRFYFQSRNAGAVLVYYHGNAGSTCDRGAMTSFFESLGVDLVFVEYAGYSNDNQDASKKAILKDVRNIHQFLDQQNYETVIIYGQSIGSGAASYHASLGNVDSLVLVTPFARLSSVGRHQFRWYPVSFLLTEDYNNIEWLESYEGNLVIFHGDQDSVIPSRFSKTLYESVSPASKSYQIIEDRGHNDIWASLFFREMLRESLLEALEK